jgi:LmbE family N-acetylglucosaminyl deacetylase
MLNLTLGRGGQPLRLLCLGSHSDDLEIGCGGTIMTLIATEPRVVVDWVVFSAPGERGVEARTSATRFLEGAAEQVVRIETFRDGFFPYVGYEIKDYFEELKGRCTPDVIFTHYRDDRHQDHRLISELTWNTFRDHLILEYEIPKYDGDLGSPNAFVHLDEGTSRLKARMIASTFQSQRNRHWFTEDAFLALMRLRGIEAASPTGYAEGFFCRKAIVALAPARGSGESRALGMAATRDARRI